MSKVPKKLKCLKYRKRSPAKSRVVVANNLYEHVAFGRFFPLFGGTFGTDSNGLKNPQSTLEPSLARITNAKSRILSLSSLTRLPFFLALPRQTPKTKPRNLDRLGGVPDLRLRSHSLRVTPFSLPAPNSPYSSGLLNPLKPLSGPKTPLGFSAGFLQNCIEPGSFSLWAGVRLKKLM